MTKSDKNLFFTSYSETLAIDNNYLTKYLGLSFKSEIAINSSYYTVHCCYPIKVRRAIVKFTNKLVIIKEDAINSRSIIIIINIITNTTDINIVVMHKLSIDTHYYNYFDY